ncbi:hypothetical protein [Lacinutrix sp. Bg11-31]|uniref:hypothetical protein n=1 Tax=Lacinutrix sp. Bg11-31 TaxID=2057808 RepID=UPI000C30D7E8|nr:hypothetical protein [Lacinutrix sp. Bg11-31]AUC83546.1 hypothetical protein CW733_15995 [Lacinutrix sp. Bg11-31]
MNQTNFLNILKAPQHIDKSQTDDLKNIVEAFPYFQSARALYIKGLKNADSFKYNNALKTTAAYTTDRSILFDFITSETFTQNEVSQFIKQNTANLLDIEVHAENISIQKSVEIDTILKQQIEDTKYTLDPDLFQPKIDTEQVASFKNEVKTKKADELIKAEDVLNIGKPLQFEKVETHSFNEWLTLTRFTPIDREVKSSKSSSEEKKSKKSVRSLAKAKKFDLIEKFIEKSPKLVAKKTATSNHNIAKAQMIQPEALMTETLARIYLEQKNYKKAIQSYKILSLKYPEKSGFFADQIKAINELQEQNNKE